MNRPNDVASINKILAPEAVCLSTLRRNTYYRIRPSRGVQLIIS